MRTRQKDYFALFPESRWLVALDIGAGAIGFFTNRSGVSWRFGGSRVCRVAPTLRARPSVRPGAVGTGGRPWLLSIDIEASVRE